MTDLDIRICPYCRAVFIEDSHMYEDPNRCPKCGADLSSDGGDDD